MNEEQLEASVASLQASNERGFRAQGWHTGRPAESRRQRIARLRRWRGLPMHYPDRFTAPPGPERENFRVVAARRVDACDIFVTAMERVDLSALFNGRSADEIMTMGLGSPDTWPRRTQFNGYCRFPAKPVIERGYGGILTYVPVHGGITYCEHELGVSTYGFDTAHAGDDENPLVRNVEWVEFQALLMARGIRVAALYEPAYLRSENANYRAELLDAYHAKMEKLVGQPFNIHNNFRSMINLLCRSL